MTLPLAETCPTCGTTTDVHTPMGAPVTIPPMHDDVSLCLCCGQVCIFKLVDGTLTTQAISPEDWIELPVQVRSLVKHAQQVIKKKRQ